MSFTAISYQPRPSGLVREKHLSENIWIRKVAHGHLDQLNSVNEIHINRRTKKGGKLELNFKILFGNFKFCNFNLKF